MLSPLPHCLVVVMIVIAAKRKNVGIWHFFLYSQDLNEDMPQSHHHHETRIVSLNSTYYIAIALNTAFVLTEVAVGLGYGSIGLLSDAGHKLLDVFSLFIALLAFKLAGSRETDKFNYGYRKTSVLISLFNAVVLLAAVCVIIYESIEKLLSPVQVSGAAISWTAGIGIVVSGVSAVLLMRHQKRDINTRGAFLHMAADALVSMGVVLSGVVISLTGWNFIDPLVSMVIALVILYNTCRLLVSAFRMSIDAVPDGVCYGEVKAAILAVPGVSGVTDLKIWAVSITETALTVKVTVAPGFDAEKVAMHIHEVCGGEKIDLVTVETRSE